MVVLASTTALAVQETGVSIIEAVFGSTGGRFSSGAVVVIGHLGSPFATSVLSGGSVRVVPGILGQGVAPTLVGDFDGDGTTGFPDFLIFAAAFSLTSGESGYRSDADLDKNGEIGFSDFLLFAAAFGSAAS